MKISKTVTTLSLLALFSIAVTSLFFTGFESYLYEYKGVSVVKLTTPFNYNSGGTGFQVTAPSGTQYTLTNAHICKMGNTLTAHAENGKKYQIEVIEVYNNHDLCILEGIKDLRSLSVASKIKLHERVWLIGYPALRPLTLESGHYVGDFYIRLWADCPEEKLFASLFLDPNSKEYKAFVRQCTIERSSQHINNIAYGGNSGSPVLNKFGNVVGVLYAGNPSQPTSSHTVPLVEIKKFLLDK